MFNYFDDFLQQSNIFPAKIFSNHSITHRENDIDEQSADYTASHIFRKKHDNIYAFSRYKYVLKLFPEICVKLFNGILIKLFDRIILRCLAYISWGTLYI